MNSVWTENTGMPHFPRLTESINTDVLIIGGGIAGILCAYKLNQAGINCIVLEADRICGGITANTTAKITIGHGLIYNKLINLLGTDKARMYLEANSAAICEYKKAIDGINCDFCETDNYVYSLKSPKVIEKELKALEKIGFQAEYSDNLSLPFATCGAIKYSSQAQFNPLMFLAEISKSLNIYENSRVKELKDTTAVCQNGQIKAKKIIVATHFPFINKHGSYFLKMYQERSYVAAFKGAKPVNGMYICAENDGFSFRDYKDYLIIGGVSERTGKQSNGCQPIKDFARKHYPSATEELNWANQDCITLDGVPYIGEYSANTPNLYVSTGFNKWGMTSSMVSAMLLCDLITGKDNRYKELFSPSRTIIRRQAAVNAATATAELLSISKKRCPHLGCALKWNPHEHSWDCPCHGSRFDEKGTLLDNPANANAKF